MAKANKEGRKYKKKIKRTQDSWERSKSTKYIKSACVIYIFKKKYIQSKEKIRKEVEFTKAKKMKTNIIELNKLSMPFLWAGQGFLGLRMRVTA